MKKFRIFSGMGGGFGGATEQCVEEFKDEDDALEYAREMALQDYEMYEGNQGIMSYDECLEECEDCEDDADDMYYQEKETWIDYYVEEVIE